MLRVRRSGDAVARPCVGMPVRRRRSVTYGNNDGYDLTVNHIPGGQSGVVVTRYRIDDSDNLTLVELVVISPLRR